MSVCMTCFQWSDCDHDKEDSEEKDEGSICILHADAAVAVNVLLLWTIWTGDPGMTWYSHCVSLSIVLILLVQLHTRVIDSGLFFTALTNRPNLCCKLQFSSVSTGMVILTCSSCVNDSTLLSSIIQSTLPLAKNILQAELVRYWG